MYPKDAVCFTQGHEKLEFYNTQTGEVDRKLPSKVLCKQCHSPIANEGKVCHLLCSTAQAGPGSLSCHAVHRASILESSS